MNIEDYRTHCISKPGVSEGFPFDEKVLVFKVMGKMFALCDVDDFVSFNVKCDPEYAQELRATYDAVQPGFHMNKSHWNTVVLDGSIPDNELYQWIDDSYDLIVASLPKKLKAELDSIE